jgi:hypothetical protein
VADWVDNYHEYDDAGEYFIREKIREHEFMKAVEVYPTRPPSNIPAPSSSGQDTGLSRRRHGFKSRWGHRRQHR